MMKFILLLLVCACAVITCSEMTESDDERAETHSNPMAFFMTGDTEEDAQPRLDREGPIFKLLRPYQGLIMNSTAKLLKIRNAMSLEKDDRKKEKFIKEVEQIRRPTGYPHFLFVIDEIFKRINIEAVPDTIQDTGDDASSKDRRLLGRDGPIFKLMRTYITPLVKTSARLLQIRNAMSFEKDENKKQHFINEVKKIRIPMVYPTFVFQIVEIFNRVTAEGDYLAISSGDCPSHGYFFITDKAECLKAAVEVGVETLTVYPGQENRAKYCSTWEQMKYLHFDFAKGKDSASNRSRMICKRKDDVNACMFLPPGSEYATADCTAKCTCPDKVGDPYGCVSLCPQPWLKCPPGMKKIYIQKPRQGFPQCSCPFPKCI